MTHATNFLCGLRPAVITRRSHPPIKFENNAVVCDVQSGGSSYIIEISFAGLKGTLTLWELCRKSKDWLA
ncbi:MAG TPA: hypothetical protein VKQ28_13250 [Candidatus Acidoferrum sp.]|nr:hypothetical protein [Candidatus Acidoferrum sp.]